MQELSGVSEAVRDLAMSRFRLIQPHLFRGKPLWINMNRLSTPPSLSMSTTASAIGSEQF